MTRDEASMLLETCKTVYVRCSCCQAKGFFTHLGSPALATVHWTATGDVTTIDIDHLDIDFAEHELPA